MSTLHETLEQRRPHAAPVIRPAILATMAYVFLLFVAWVQRMVTMPWGAEMFHVGGSTLWLLRGLAAGLIAWVSFDAWRGQESTGRLGAWIVAALAIVTLGGVLVLLTRVAALQAA